MTLWRQELVSNQLDLLREVALELDSKFWIDSMNEEAFSSNLNFAVTYDGVPLKHHFHIFDLLPNDLWEARNNMRNEFAKYLLQIGWKP